MSIKKTVPGNTTKKDLKKVGATPVVSDGGATGEGSMHVLFQTSFSASVDLAPHKCVCPSSLLRSLQISPGNMIAIENPITGNFVISRAFVQKRPIPSQSNNERLVMHRLWQINFDGMESKKVIVKSMRDPRFRIFTAKSLVLMIEDETNHELKQSLELRKLLRESLEGCVVSINTKVSISIRAKSVTLEVYCVVPNENDNDMPIDTVKLYQYSAKTELVVIMQHQEAQPYLVINKSQNDISLYENPTKISACDALRQLQDSFVGYENVARLALDTALLGLGFLNEIEYPIDPVSMVKAVDDILKIKPIFSLPVGLLVYGPPGTGKSQLVRSIIDAVKCNVVYIDSKLLLSTFQGDAESHLRSKFNEARDLSPCCLVIENMDMIFPSRTSHVSDISKRIVSSYLSLVDELHNAPSRVFIMGTTTKPLDIDSAVRRAGRIDREIELTVPSANDREKILQFLCKKHGITIKEDSNKHLKMVEGQLWIKSYSIQNSAKVAHGMVASDLVQVLKEACYIHLVNRHTLIHANNVSVVENHNSSAGETFDSVICNLLEDFSEMSMAEHKSADIIQFDQRNELSEATMMAAVHRIPPSALREVVVEVPTVRWDDIGGMQSVKQSLKQVVEWPILHPEWFSSMGIPPLKGVLLYGPPGCSKTLMAKAVATESSMNFLAVRGPELLSKWLGESEKAVQSLFKKARAAAPSIVFFDEIDALAGVRGESSAGVSDRVLSQLLTELDGIQGRKQVVVIAATNRPDMLDPALIRPGRIDRKVYVPPPDEYSRESILQLELKKLPIAGVIDFQQLVKATRGFSGAEVVAVCNEAALNAIDRDADALNQEDFLAAARKITPQITFEMLKFYDTFARKN